MGVFESGKLRPPLHGRSGVPHCFRLQQDRGATVIRTFPECANEGGPLPLEQVSFGPMASFQRRKISRRQNRLVPVYLRIEISGLGQSRMLEVMNGSTPCCPSVTGPMVRECSVGAGGFPGSIMKASIRYPVPI